MQLIADTKFIRARAWLGYALAILFSLGALGPHFAAGDLLVGFPFLTFFPALVLVTFLGGLGPGILVSTVGALLADYFLISANNDLRLVWPSGVIALALFGFAVSIVVGLTHGMLKALDRQSASEKALRVLNLDLEPRDLERTATLEKEMFERSVAESQLRHMQKMESVGQLTGGIAHDFNNMLAVITGSLDIARRHLSVSEDPMIETCLNNAIEGAQRAASLTARLLAFSRLQPLEPIIVDVNRLVGGMSELLCRTLGETVHIETVLAAGLWHAFVDSAQLESAVVNLAVNARDAMPSGGKLTIETANSDLDERYARVHVEVEAGQYVLISVTDTGTGMAPEVVERAFDPFYTTKGVGKGTGLGLSQVFGFVKQSGGHVKIYSEIDKGTTVKLYLPRHLGSDVASHSVQSDVRPSLMGNSEVVVLVVEDDEQVRNMTVDALGELNYTVVQASNGTQALEKLLIQPHVDLLFTDIVMPEMSGRQLAEQACDRLPGLKVLYTTGYTRNAVVHNSVLDVGVAFLPKPFTLQQLATKLRDVLANQGANRPNHVPAGMMSR
jgi:signal transduction histidine kinase/CheY-like chemotaxis protein